MSNQRKAGLKQTSIVLEESILKELDELAEATYRSRNKTIELLIKEALDERHRYKTKNEED